jgi:hypothetical protein
MHCPGGVFDGNRSRPLARVSLCEQRIQQELSTLVICGLVLVEARLEVDDPRRVAVPLDPVRTAMEPAGCVSKLDLDARARTLLNW